jgi:hypothetical protein
MFLSSLELKMKKLPTIKSLRNDSPWEVAKKFGVCYNGDMNPIPHNGTWFETKNWKEYGYATAVRIQESCGTLSVELCTINKHDDEMEKAFSFCGIEHSEDKKPSIEEEIYACMSYGWLDIEAVKTFRSDNGKNWGDFPEFKIMKEVKRFFAEII